MDEMNRTQFQSTLTREQSFKAMTALCEKWTQRAEAQGYKGKLNLKLQTEFFLGAAVVLDTLFKEPIDPIIMFTVMRGGDIVKEWNQYKQARFDNINKPNS